MCEVDGGEPSHVTEDNEETWGPTVRVDAVVVVMEMEMEIVIRDLVSGGAALGHEQGAVTPRSRAE